MKTIQLTEAQTNAILGQIESMDFSEDIDIAVSWDENYCKAEGEFELENIIENDVIYGYYEVELCYDYICDDWVIKSSSFNAYAYDENDEKMECIPAA